MGKEFRASTKRVRTVEWRGILDYPRNLIPREVRAADLLIIGQDGAFGDTYSDLNPGVAILRAGRPVLVVPNKVESLSARRIVIAWKDTREARRAIMDALPFLRAAAEVLVVEVCETGAESEAHDHIDDVTNYLVRHKVIVGANTCLRAQSSIAPELQRFAKDEGADLIVAGGYGHTRLGEWIFGGVTRSLLADSPVCCLFSN